MDASDFYHGIEGLNCAQAVLKFHQNKLDISDEEIMFHEIHGGGRAPEGMCGALYATLTMISNKDDQKKAIEMFAAKTGYVDCRSLIMNKTVSCKECVNISSDILTEITEKCSNTELV